MADTLCLSCAKCYGDCPWSERDPETKRIKFQPVPGWTAEPTWKRGCGASYHVVACPLYVSDGKDYSAGRGQKPKFDVRKVAACMRAGMTDREIMRRTGIQSDSTLRAGEKIGGTRMLTIVIQVDAPPGQAIGVKEHLAMCLERYGDTRVVEIRETGVEQMRMEGAKQHELPWV